MGQVILELDTDTIRKLDTAAERAGVSRSRWIADLVRHHARSEWPREVVELAGAWSEAPTAEELRASQGSDVPREPF